MAWVSTDGDLRHALTIRELTEVAPRISSGSAAKAINLSRLVAKGLAAVFASSRALPHTAGSARTFITIRGVIGGDWSVVGGTIEDIAMVMGSSKWR